MNEVPGEFQRPQHKARGPAMFAALFLDFNIFQRHVRGEFSLQSLGAGFLRSRAPWAEREEAHGQGDYHARRVGGFQPSCSMMMHKHPLRHTLPLSRRMRPNGNRKVMQTNQAVMRRIYIIIYSSFCFSCCLPQKW